MRAPSRLSKEHILLMHVFIQFLASKDALDKWINNIIDVHSNHTGAPHYTDNSHVPSASDEFITFMPMWANTAEGQNYWFDLSREWQYVLSIYPNVNIPR